MRRLNRIGALIAAAAVSIVGLAPKSFTAVRNTVTQNTRPSCEQQQPTPAPTAQAKPGQVISEQTLGGFTVRSRAWSPIWTGKPRGSYGGMFKRRKGQRWVGQ